MMQPGQLIGTHLELRISVRLSDVGQQLSAGLAHVSCSLQQVLTRLKRQKKMKNESEDKRLRNDIERPGSAQLGAPPCLRAGRS